MKPKFKFTIDIQKCKGCSLCLDKCKNECLELTNKVNEKGLLYIAIKDKAKCNGCGLCAIVCPDCAMEITEINGED